ncbi:MAG: hypothetical protein ACI88G_000771 [Woeseiaceae bacterium]|jgi:hypothetical protein
MIRYLRQVLAYIVFAGAVFLFASGPPYRMLEDQEAIVSITFSHAGQRIGQCRALSQEELDELPPNMRKPNDCPRERHLVYVSLFADEQLLFAETLAPSGLWNDGKANVYRRITVPAGDYELRMAMNDSGSDKTFDYERIESVSIKPGQNLVIGFDELLNDFEIR